MAPRVLISYSHDSDEHAERVLDLADRLRDDGVDCRLDQYLTKGPAQGWPLWMNEEIEAADTVLVVFTERYAAKAKEPKRSGVRFESVLVLQDLYDAGMLNEKFIPVVFDRADERHIVKWLRPYTHYKVGDEAGYEKLRRRLVGDPEVVMPPLGTAVKKGPRKKAAASSGLKVNLTHLPSAGPLLVGRETETARLNAAWESPAQQVISIVARGGEGKTNLVRHWLNAMSADGWRGAEKVFGWSFFSQGSKEKAASADQFVDEALRFFGNTSAEAIKSPHERGERLAEFVGSGRNLLILDGLEPLQYPPSGAMEGRLKDPALQTLLAGLSAHNGGLCVITTRESLPELAGGRENVSPEIELPALTDAQGAELLRRLGVNGTDEQRAAVSHRLGGHALSLQLLGTYLHEVHDGDVARAGEAALLDHDAASREHVGRILDTYERWLSGRTLAEDDPARAEVERSGAPMLAILRLLGLFDRPAEMELIDVLRAEPPIPGLTEPLVGLPHPEWKRALSRLRKLKLIDNDKTAIDAHPLIREYFAAQLAQRAPEGAREAHRRLYETLKISAPEFPETLPEMMPLYAAVRHGCKAGLWQEALDDVFYTRIYRGHHGYSWRKLGLFGTDLEALTAFTSTDNLPTTGIRDDDRAWIGAATAFCLKAIARHREMRHLLETSISMAIRQHAWRNAATGAFNLADVHLALGDVTSALRWATYSIELADRAPDGAPTSVFARAMSGDALHASGARHAALSAFDDALRRQKQIDGQAEVLYSMQGFRHRDFQLNTSPPSPEVSDLVREEAQVAMSIYTSETGTLDYALDYLTLARTYVFENAANPQQSVSGAGAITQAENAVSWLRQAGTLDILPMGLLCRAAVYRTWPDLHRDALARANRDITEAEQIANGGSLLRWQIEAALERARLHLALSAKDKAREKLDEAKRLIKKTEAPYVPHVPTWEEWEPPAYVNVFDEGEIVRYRRADADVAALERELT